jgi:type IV fimbrial biogenesis protein FimT
MLGNQKGGRVLTRFKTGFSLIEMLIAVAVLALLMALGTPSFSAFLQNRKIRNAADAVLNGLNFAKAEAVRRNTSISFVLDGGSGWTVGCLTVSGAACPAVIQSRSASEGSVNVATTATNLSFNGFGKASSLAPGVNATINVTNPLGVCEDIGGTMRCLRVVVTPGGQIRSCDPKLTISSPTSPQAC